MAAASASLCASIRITSQWPWYAALISGVVPANMLGKLTSAPCRIMASTMSLCPAAQALDRPHSPNSLYTFTSLARVSRNLRNSSGKFWRALWWNAAMDGGSSERDRLCFYTSSSSSWTTRGRRTFFFWFSKGGGAHLFYEADNDGVGRTRISFWGTGHNH